MIVLDQPPQLILPPRPAIIRPGVELGRYFPVEWNRETRRAIVAELGRRGVELDDRAGVRRFLAGAELNEAAIPFGMFTSNKSIDGSYISGTNVTTNGSSFTFTSVAIGDEGGGNRLIVAMLHFSGGNTTIRTATNCTIGGIAATKLKEQGGNASTWATVSIWGAYVPTGTTATVVATLSGSADRCRCGIWKCVNASITPYASAGFEGANPNLSINWPEGGYALAGSMTAGGGGSTYSALTEQYDVIVESSEQASAASGANTGATGTLSLTLTRSTGTAAAAASVSLSPVS